MDDLSATSSTSEIGFTSNRGNTKKKTQKKVRKLTPLEGKTKDISLFFFSYYFVVLIL